ncbi:eamA-like transporter family domain-containing protein [Ditylenchus destructor]|uniref:EamA-like transporter family domain-containing protein n=1 Tax=Ditylenchus destructor TaxID=166010 RepID=A0AAD4N4F0_9BILA|nr:eamA-like transporter family domain-containing protein [Ditylenchus destructor]
MLNKNELKKDPSNYEKVATSDAEPGPVEKSKPCKKVCRQLIISITLSLACGLAWAIGRQFTKTALNIDSSRFYAPYSLVWFNTNFMILCFPVFLIYNRIFRGIPTRKSWIESASVFGEHGLTYRSFFIRVTPFIFLWICANYSYSQALGYISASAVLCIASANVAIVCVLEWIMLKKGFDWLPLISVILAIIGVCLISLDDEYAGNIQGIFLSVFCAFTSALYKVLFKRVNGSASLGQVSLFMSALGFFNAFLNIIPTSVLIWNNVDYIEWAYIPWTPLCMAALLSLTFNFLANFGIALLGPLVISIGMLIGMPASAVIDVIFRKMEVTEKFIVGCSCIVLSFALVALPFRLLCKKNREKNLEELN